MNTVLREIWMHIRSLKPAFMSRNPHFNFNTVHYFYIIGMAIFCSICIYPNGHIPYIDALFFGSGAATQSGLNTIDLNRLNTWQQLVLYFISTMCTPIAINTFVVFLRLYWFEKRFQHVAKEAKKNRRSIGKSFTKGKEDGDIEREERGVQGRNIQVMHDTMKTNVLMNDGHMKKESIEQIDKAHAMSQEGTARSSNETHSRQKDSGSDSGEERVVPNQPQIKFAHQVKRSDGMADEALRLPSTRSQEEHIRILQRQRNEETNNEPSLRIPGPRDADAGISPRAVQDSDALSQTFSNGSRHSQDRGILEDGSHLDAPNDTETEAPARRNITIQEPAPRTPPTDHIVENGLAAKNVVSSALKFRGKSTEKADHDSQSKTDGPLASKWNSIRKALSVGKEETPGIPYLSWEPTIGRNSVFIDLTEQQREELGGIEYRSLKTLALILTCYNIGFSILAVVGLLPWILESTTYGSIVDADGQGRVWWAFFTSMSAFTDLGFTLTPDSMISFQTAVWPLLFMTFLIIIGNTGFPVMLRFIIWATTLWVPSGSGIYEELKFLLDHPRRCFTLLFPSKANWVLFWILVGLNGLDLILFIVLDLGNSIVTLLPLHIRFLDGWFQAASTRTAGFGVVNLADLHPAIQVSYLIMMYISVLPIAMSVRRTNVYEEKSLGIYGSPQEEMEDEGESSYLGAHLRRQLSFDLWFIFMGFFIIAIAEGPRIQDPLDPGFSMFNVLFEIVSAYGTVGLSLGYPTINASFSAEFNVVSKLVIIAMQIRGRHRGLPYELDRAILLPSEHLQAKEAKEAEQMLARRQSSLSFSNMETLHGTSTQQKTRGRSLSTHRRQGSNFLGNMLHPGPAIPNSHRIDPAYERRRRNSVMSRADDGEQRESLNESRRNTAADYENVSPRTKNKSDFGPPLGSIGGGSTRRSASRVSGRRSFFVEGLNTDSGPQT